MVVFSNYTRGVQYKDKFAFGSKNIIIAVYVSNNF